MEWSWFSWMVGILGGVLCVGVGTRLRKRVARKLRDKRIWTKVEFFKD